MRSNGSQNFQKLAKTTRKLAFRMSNYYFHFFYTEMFVSFNSTSLGEIKASENEKKMKKFGRKTKRYTDDYSEFSAAEKASQNKAWHSFA